MTSLLKEYNRGVLVYVLSGKEYCCDLQTVVRIIRPSEANGHRIVNNGKSLIFNGNNCQIISLHDLFNLPFKNTGDSRRLIIMDLYSTTFAFFVDRITEILATENLLIDKSLKLEPVSNLEYVKYILSYQNKSIQWPDYEMLCKKLNQYQSKKEWDLFDLNDFNIK